MKGGKMRKEEIVQSLITVINSKLDKISKSFILFLLILFFFPRVTESVGVGIDKTKGEIILPDGSKLGVECRSLENKEIVFSTYWDEHKPKIKISRNEIMLFSGKRQVKLSGEEVSNGIFRVKVSADLTQSCSPSKEEFCLLYHGNWEKYRFFLEKEWREAKSQTNFIYKFYGRGGHHNPSCNAPFIFFQGRNQEELGILVHKASNSKYIPWYQCYSRPLWNMRTTWRKDEQLTEIWTSIANWGGDYTERSDAKFQLEIYFAFSKKGEKTPLDKIVQFFARDIKPKPHIPMSAAFSAAVNAKIPYMDMMGFPKETLLVVGYGAPDDWPKVVPELVKKAHQRGRKVLMYISPWYVPTTRCSWGKEFVKKHPEAVKYVQSGENYSISYIDMDLPVSKEFVRKRVAMKMGWGVDGFFIDCGGSEEMYKLVYEEAKKIKPDAIIYANYGLWTTQGKKYIDMMMMEYGKYENDPLFIRSTSTLTYYATRPKVFLPYFQHTGPKEEAPLEQLDVFNDRRFGISCALNHPDPIHKRSYMEMIRSLYDEDIERFYVISTDKGGLIKKQFKGKNVWSATNYEIENRISENQNQVKVLLNGRDASVLVKTKLQISTQPSVPITVLSRRFDNYLEMKIKPEKKARISIRADNYMNLNPGSLMITRQGEDITLKARYNLRGKEISFEAPSSMWTIVHIANLGYKKLAEYLDRSTFYLPTITAIKTDALVENLKKMGLKFSTLEKSLEKNPDFVSPSISRPLTEAIFATLSARKELKNISSIRHHWAVAEANESISWISNYLARLAGYRHKVATVVEPEFISLCPGEESTLALGISKGKDVVSGLHLNLICLAKQVEISGSGTNYRVKVPKIWTGENEGKILAIYEGTLPGSIPWRLERKIYLHINPIVKVSFQEGKLKCMIGESVPVKLKAQNLSRDTISAKLNIKVPSGWQISKKLSFYLKQGETKKGSFNIKVPTDTKTGLYKVKVEVITPSRKVGEEELLVDVRSRRPSTRIVRVKTPVKIDAMINEWTVADKIKIDRKEQIHISDWGGSTDLSGYASMMWDEKNIYLLFVVSDNKFVQPFEKENIWKGDCIQFALYLNYDNIEKAINPDEYAFSYALAKTPKGAQVYRYYPDGRLDPKAMLKVFRSNPEWNYQNNLIYEVAIPWKSLGNFVPRIGKHIGFTFTINDCDEKDFRGWAQWTWGICGRGFHPAWFGKAEFVE